MFVSHIFKYNMHVTLPSSVFETTHPSAWEKTEILTQTIQHQLTVLLFGLNLILIGEIHMHTVLPCITEI